MDDCNNYYYIITVINILFKKLISGLVKDNNVSYVCVKLKLPFSIIYEYLLSLFRNILFGKGQLRKKVMLYTYLYTKFQLKLLRIGLSE